MLIYSWGNIIHTHTHTHTHAQTPSFWLKFSEIVYAPQKKENKYCLFILCLSLANIGNHGKKKKNTCITKNDAPRQQKKECSKREGPTTFHPGTFSSDTKEMKEHRSCAACVLPCWQVRKKWKDLRELGRVWKGTHTTMGENHATFAF